MNPEDVNDLLFNPQQFCGTARLFPIPNLVMFPHVVQPLHIFEDRYRELMEDCLSGDGLIAMPIPKEGWEIDYAGSPTIQPWACLGRVVLHRKLDDGCYNILLMGVSRLKIVRELDPVRSFRQAEVEVVADLSPPLGDPRIGRLREQLCETIRQQMPCCDTHDAVAHILENAYPLGQLTDLVAYALPLQVCVKQQLLAEPDVIRRAEQLCQLIHSEGAGPLATMIEKGFPPPFSKN